MFRVRAALRRAVLCFALVPLAALAEELLLAPGKSITILDAEDATVRVVITAPANAPLNLTALLTSDPGESVRSVVTRIQLQQARGLVANADGSLSLSRAPLPAPAQGATMLEGGVLVHRNGKYVLHSSPPPVAWQGAPASNPRNPAGGLQISKPGTSNEQAQRDLRQCRAYAEAAAAGFLTSAHKASMYNIAMNSCLRGFGYEIRAAGS